MKRVKLEPKYKKCVVEYQVYEKEIDNVKLRATLEIGWRYGSFDINIPETEEEALAWANAKVGQLSYYNTIEEVYNDYGCADWDELKVSFCPSEDDESVDIDDYDYELIETWDGCWEDWDVTILGDTDAVFDADELCEQITEGWNENSWDYIQEEGWVENVCYYEMQCSPKFTEYDEHGNLIEEETLEA